MTEENANFLRVQAWRCRNLAAQITDEPVQGVLTEMADEYEARAAELDGKPGLPTTRMTCTKP
jgi:hypothetical protein